jgi:inorganic triphosphatase YgiF
MATMEVELKLALPPDSAAALCRHPLLAGKKVQRDRVFNLYLDTPDFDLWRARMALRLRKKGETWLQTLKTAGSALGGLHQRGEWEYVQHAPEVDLARFRESPLAELPCSSRLHLLLKPAFVADFERIAWQIESAPGMRVEVALDRGVIEGGGRKSAICEVEIEVLTGSADGAYDVALALLQDLSLRPLAASKAERGYDLLLSNPHEARKAQPLILFPGWSPQEAFKAIAAHCLEHFEANVEGALASNDPEFVHQLRVALRRLRSALRIFRPADLERLDEELKWLAGAMGATREWDVFVTAGLPELADENAALRRRLLVAAKRHRKAARDAARESLASARCARALLELGRWLCGTEALPPTSRTATQPTLPGLHDFAARTIRRRHKRLLRDAAGIATLDAAARHRVRIDAKRLRYAVDFFQSLYRKERTAPYLEILTTIQDALGEMNDAVTAERLMAALGVPQAVRLYVQGWHVARAQARLAELEKCFAALGRCRRFWRMKPARVDRDSVANDV